MERIPMLNFLLEQLIIRPDMSVINEGKSLKSKSVSYNWILCSMPINDK